MKTVKSLTWAIKQNDDNITLQFIGELSRDTLLPLWEQRASFLSAEKRNTSYIFWDLSQVSRIDSAGFALLCDFLQYCQTVVKQEYHIVLKNAPSQLFTLADLFGLSAWIATFVQSDGNN
ncbi:lipid asymmetry maintenance protein MlaB [Pasteurella oralis]|uniref:Lipid asymmetry maintenance protein MlaB n=1 Tax=Pasteurella oralis TaxID=1071947 RepID=A0ABW4NS49_9PAST|nr:lipid asymmetry maintenance protein MlaB [Pasteurella oralis]MDO5053759.1 lipid asymmetry maintenance protein MlaB [Pasteurella oralis]